MSYQKTTIRAVELTLDKCSEVFGSAPCTATGTKCYNTKTTCKDVDNYNKTDWSIKFLDVDCKPPTNYDGFPCIIGVTEPSTQIDEAKGLAPVGSVSVTLSDFKAYGDDIDPYYSTRTQSGHFFRRLQAITKHFKNRSLTIYESTLLDDGTYDAVNLITRKYYITDISGPDNTNKITIKAKEPFDRLKKQFPPTATGELDGAITNTATSITLSGANLTSEYKTISGAAPSSGSPVYLKIEDEYLKCTAISGTTFTVVRGAFSSSAAAHDDETNVQQVMLLDGNAGDIWEDLLLYSDIDSGLIDSAGMVVQQGLGLDAYDVYRVVVKQERVDVILKSLLENCVSFSWWDAESQLVKIKIRRAPLPTDSPTSITDDDIIATRPTPQPQEKLRITRCTIYTDIIDWAASITDKGNYYRPITYIDADAEASTDYDEIKEKIIFAPWYGSDDYNTALSIAVSNVFRYGAAPVKMTMQLENYLSNDISVGDVVALTCSNTENSDGSVPEVQGWIFGKKRKKGLQIAHEFTYMSAGFATRCWFYSDKSNTYATASDDDRKYAYLADSNGKMSDGTKGYGPQ